MREIRVSDVTMKQAASSKELTLSFKEKLEIAKQLDHLGVSAIEIEGIEKPKADSLRIKSIASLVKDSTLAVPVQMSDENIELVWNALKEAAHPRLQLEVPVSPATMEYIYHKKADSILGDIASTIEKCVSLTDDVEFVADDATRTDIEYLGKVIKTAIDAGANTITVCDAAGNMLPDEFADFIKSLFEVAPQLKDVTLGISCSNNLYIADACAVAGVIAGANEVKSTTHPMGIVSLPKAAKILSSKSDVCQVSTSVRDTQLKRTTSQIARICEQAAAKTSPFGDVSSEEDETITLSVHDDKEAVMACVSKLGYDLSSEDADLVYESFVRIASKKESVGSRELDAIVASAALQVPPTYVLESYVINSGNLIKATANIRLKREGETVESVCIGDGPIDASFLAIEQIVGKRYELDDWQMSSVTEGQEAMGECIVKLISEGKMYSGRGISTDIVGSSIRAYINALNKIVYEEQN